MTFNERLVAIKARADAATPGPWQECGADRDGCQCCTVWSLSADIPVADTKTAIVYEGKVAPESVMRADATFIAHSRTDMTFLLGEVHRLMAEAQARADADAEECRLAAEHDAVMDAEQAQIRQRLDEVCAEERRDK